MNLHLNSLTHSHDYPTADIAIPPSTTLLSRVKVVIEIYELEVPAGIDVSVPSPVIDQSLNSAPSWYLGNGLKICAAQDGGGAHRRRNKGLLFNWNWSQEDRSLRLPPSMSSRSGQYHSHPEDTIGNKNQLTGAKKSVTKIGNIFSFFTCFPQL
jgi:hypothetical protein